MSDSELTNWFENIKTSPDLLWKYSGQAKGVCKRHTGPSIWFAAVHLAIMPSEAFEVETHLSEEEHIYLTKVGWLNQIIYGAFDVMLTYMVAPVRRFKLVVLAIEYNDIETTPMAMRLAARDATSQIVQAHLHSTAD